MTTEKKIEPSKQQPKAKTEQTKAEKPLTQAELDKVAAGTEIGKMGNIGKM
jgi:hypothetical protein